MSAGTSTVDSSVTLSSGNQTLTITGDDGCYCSLVGNSNSGSAATHMYAAMLLGCMWVPKALVCLHTPLGGVAVQADESDVAHGQLAQLSVAKRALLARQENRCPHWHDRGLTAAASLTMLTHHVQQWIVVLWSAGSWHPTLPAVVMWCWCPLFPVVVPLARSWSLNLPWGMEREVEPESELPGR